jgi:NRAMP (natural resistance-associated macrophage protein)-like metal ion transporter
MKAIKKFALRRGLRQIGPGLITGAADDDPSGIATYSQAGAQFGYSMLWTVVFTLPLMVAIQIISARIGYVTRSGLGANIKASFPRWVLLLVVAMLLAANTLNVAADIAAMAEALRLLVGGSAHFYAVTFGLLCLVAGLPALQGLCALAEVADPGTVVLRGGGVHGARGLAAGAERGLPAAIAGQP